MDDDLFDNQVNSADTDTLNGDGGDDYLNAADADVLDTMNGGSQTIGDGCVYTLIVGQGQDSFTGMEIVCTPFVP